MWLGGVPSLSEAFNNEICQECDTDPKQTCLNKIPTNFETVNHPTNANTE